MTVQGYKCFFFLFFSNPIPEGFLEEAYHLIKTCPNFYAYSDLSLFVHKRQQLFFYILLARYI